MGAWMTEQTEIGKSAAEAYRSAVASAQAEYGHQDGYSGAINSKADGFRLVTLPARMTYAKFQALLEDSDMLSTEYLADDVRFARQDVAEKRTGAKARLAKAERALVKGRREAQRFADKVERAGFDYSEFQSLASTYHDKWEAPLAVELRGAEAARYQKRRGQKAFRFFGYAPC